MTDILIIEDDPIQQIKLKLMLRELGHTGISCVYNLTEARKFISSQTPSLLIADVFLENETTLDFLTELLQAVIPTILVTASKDIGIYNSIKDNNQYGYLIKPVDPITLQSTINLITSRQSTGDAGKDTFFVRQGKKQHKLALTDILWLEGEGNYTFIYTRLAKYATKQSLLRIVDQLDTRFVKCHKKFYVNADLIDYFQRDAVMINGQEIPISYTFKKEFLEKVHVRKKSSLA